MSYISRINVGQIELINEIYNENYQIINEINENIYSQYIKMILHKHADKGFGG
jgi:hypothetical protein